MTQFGGPTDDDLTTYTLAENCSSPPLFGVPVASECYQFERGKLYGVSVFLDGSDAFDKMRYELSFRGLMRPPICGTMRPAEVMVLVAPDG
jgi:hypothetical protein